MLDVSASSRTLLLLWKTASITAARSLEVTASSLEVVFAGGTISMLTLLDLDMLLATSVLSGVIKVALVGLDRQKFYCAEDRIA